jgi:dephospho-CoA kinase
MLRMAITGGIACGKSSVGAILSAQDVPVCDSDELAHKAILRGTDAYTSIVTDFGQEVLGEDGEIDRAKLGAIVFRDSGRLQRLNAIVHPPVRESWERWLACHDGSTAMAAVMVPLLFEIGDEESWDAVLCVSSTYDCQKIRLRERGLNEIQIEMRFAAQLPNRNKMQRADHVIFNNGSLQWLKEQTERVLKSILER